MLFYLSTGNSKLIHLLHNSENPTSVFSILDTGTKQIPLVADSLFDLLILKMQPAYSSKKQTKVRKARCFTWNVMILCQKSKIIIFSSLFDWYFCVFFFFFLLCLQIESKGPRFELGDFVIKLGSVTMSQTFKGVLVEVRIQMAQIGIHSFILKKKKISLRFILFAFRWNIVRV